jgi:hypothetical protein
VMLAVLVVVASLILSTLSSKSLLSFIGILAPV